MKNSFKKIILSLSISVLAFALLTNKVGAITSIFSPFQLGTSSPILGRVLVSTGTSTSASWMATSTLGLTTSPAGVSGDFQINLAGSFGTLSGARTDTTGNTRGINALDLQSVRSTLTQVASGACSSAFGLCNTASGNYSQAIGYGNCASGCRSAAFGFCNTSSACNSSVFGVCVSVSGVNSAGGGLRGGSGTCAANFGVSASAGSCSAAFGVQEIAQNCAVALGFQSCSGGTLATNVGLSNAVTAGHTQSAVFGAENISGVCTSDSTYGNSSGSAYRSAVAGVFNLNGCPNSSINRPGANNQNRDFNSIFGVSNCFAGDGNPDSFNQCINHSNLFGFNNVGTVSNYNGVENLTLIGNCNCGANLTCAFAIGYNLTGSSYQFQFGLSDANKACLDSAGNLTTKGLISNFLKVIQPTTLASIVGDITGNARGHSALDVQSLRGAVTRVASGNCSSAFGQNDTASGAYSTAIGYCNTASCYRNSALGVCNIASCRGASASGYKNTVSAYKGSAFGYLNTVCSTASAGSALGYCNIISGNRSSGSGYFNTVSGNYSIGIGYSNLASGCCSSIFGNGDTASACMTSVFGNGITNSCANSAMIGPSNSAKLTILSTGETQAPFFTATSTTATSTFNYDVNVIGKLKLQDVTTLATIIGDTTGNTRGTSALDIQSKRSAVTQVASGDCSLAVGQCNTASNIFASAFGKGNTASGSISTASGYGNTASGSQSAAVGVLNNASGNQSFGFGVQNSVSGYQASAVGFCNQACCYSASALGRGNFTHSDYASAMGYVNHACGCCSVAVGICNIANACNASAFGSHINNALASTTEIGPSDAAKLIIDQGGNLKFSGGLFQTAGANKSFGTTTLSAGTKTVLTNKVTANSVIFLTVESLGTVTAPTMVGVTAKSAGTSFTITSANVVDTSVIGWEIIEPN